LGIARGPGSSVSNEKLKEQMKAADRAGMGIRMAGSPVPLNRDAIKQPKIGPIPSFGIFSLASAA